MSDLVTDNMQWAREKTRQITRDWNRRMDLEDYEQEALCALVGAVHDWQGEGDFRAFAYKCIANHLRDVQRKENRALYEFSSAGVMDELEKQDAEEWLAWSRHNDSEGWYECEEQWESLYR